MTTPNHSIVAGVTAVAVAGQPGVVRVVAAAFLLMLHLVADFVPHKHWWDNYRCHDPLALGNRLGVALEVFVGMAVVPWLFWRFAGVDFGLVWWLALASNLIDFVTPLSETLSRLNNWVHCWEQELPQHLALRAEVAQSVLLVLFVGVLLWLGPS